MRISWKRTCLAVLTWICFIGQSSAGTVTLETLRFSAAKPVPHFHYEGEVVPGDLDRVATAIGRYIDCDPRALPESGGNCAVITMKSEGGNYVEGLAMARFFRERGIATWVRTGSYCYSACAFAFLGGSGASSSSSIGDYIDRTIEPGATLGFHAPYATAEVLGDLVAQFGVEEVLGGNRESIALMIQELVNWNVDKSVLARITSMGSEEAYRALTAQDLYLLRVALPDASQRVWSSDPVDALRNACMRLIAQREDVWPYDSRDRLPREMTYAIGTDEKGNALSGYKLVAAPSGLTISYCATPTADAHLGADADIALYYGPGIGGTMRPALTFFHRPDGWSTLGSGGPAAQRILQKGTIGHYFLPPDAELGGSLALVWRLIGEEFMETGQLR